MEYVFTQPRHLEQGVTQAQFFSWVLLIWIKIFLLDWLPEQG